MKTVKNPHAMCERLYNLVHNLTGQLKDLIAQKIYDPRGELLLCYVASINTFINTYKKIPRSLSHTANNSSPGQNCHVEDIVQYPMNS